MRPSRSIPLALAALVMAGAVATPAQARRPGRAFSPTPPPPAGQPLVSLSLERPGGHTLPSYFHFGSLYFAGSQGDHYNLRLTNNTGERVEVVVTVDGRDVISGEVGNFKRQRGYVLDAYDTVVVDGFRQSLDHVAAFQFSNLESSYTARMGTPQNAGVVGVAIFKESRRSARRHRRQLRKQAVTVTPPSYEPYYRGPSGGGTPQAFPESPNAAEAQADEAEAPAAVDRRSSRHDGGFSPMPAPEPSTQLGTAYGDTKYSAVREVAFRRHRKRKPDGFLTVYYDSLDRLAARGIDVHHPAPYRGPHYEPQPFVESGFAAPPPRR